jgi:hypothetical protein
MRALRSIGEEGAPREGYEFFEWGSSEEGAKCNTAMMSDKLENWTSLFEPGGAKFEKESAAYSYVSARMERSRTFSFLSIVFL